MKERKFKAIVSVISDTLPEYVSPIKKVITLKDIEEMLNRYFQ